MNDQDSSYKGKPLTGAGLVSEVQSIIYLHGKKHGGVQADMMLEKELRILHLDPWATEATVELHWA